MAFLTDSETSTWIETILNSSRDSNPIKAEKIQPMKYPSQKGVYCNLYRRELQRYLELNQVKARVRLSASNKPIIVYLNQQDYHHNVKLLQESPFQMPLEAIKVDSWLKRMIEWL
jgi:hypothetical protein